VNRQTAPRGLTLIELVIGLALSSMVIVAGTTMLLSQQKAFRASTGQRSSQEAGRLALDELARSLRSAGYGMDSPLTFDFGDMPNVPRSALGIYGRGFTQGYACGNGGPVRCRDRTDGPDEVVFYSRDPLFSRALVDATTAQLTVLGELRQPLYAGQILQVMCRLDPMTRGYVTVSQGVAATAAAVPDLTKKVVIQLRAGVKGLNVPAFPNENDVLTDACFTAGAAVVAKVDRYRYYVQSYDEAGNKVAIGTPGSRPYLMLDQGLKDQNGNDILLPVAADVEDLQLSYLYPPAAAGGGARLVGARQGTSAADEAFPITVGVAPPAMAAPSDSAARTTGNPANIQGVQVSVVVRTPEPDVEKTQASWTVIPAAGNRPDLVGIQGFRRGLFETTVTVRNMQAADFTYTVVDPAGLPGVNLGGG
jgi:type IV pilus assembly protein PilW